MEDQTKTAHHKLSNKATSGWLATTRSVNEQNSSDSEDSEFRGTPLSARISYHAGLNLDEKDAFKLCFTRMDGKTEQSDSGSVEPGASGDTIDHLISKMRRTMGSIDPTSTSSQSPSESDLSSVSDDGDSFEDISAPGSHLTAVHRTESLVDLTNNLMPVHKTENLIDLTTGEGPARLDTEVGSTVGPSAAKKPARLDTEDGSTVGPSAAKKPARLDNEDGSTVGPSAAKKPARLETEVGSTVGPSAVKKPALHQKGVELQLPVSVVGVTDGSHHHIGDAGKTRPDVRDPHHRHDRPSSEASALRSTLIDARQKTDDPHLSVFAEGHSALSDTHDPE
ncbi:hypothetical protein BV898_11394 [Hypsibius exemplaris]|uniref:Uncharacterized protein n=1 Tax=Hypsibius exemplaris TaxID=2072580 RepID=A0A1W0WGV4_HYPEX|nr:hypothetical protein BV898_11394 [Hypsibius exemplaris]